MDDCGGERGECEGEGGGVAGANVGGDAVGQGERCGEHRWLAEHAALV